MKLAATGHRIATFISKIFTPGRSFLALIFTVSFLLRLPSLLPVYSYGDECIYLTLGNAVRQGLTLYKEIHDNKPPLLYLMTALAGNLFWLRALLLIWSLATIYLFYRIALTIFKNGNRAVVISTLIFALLSSIPPMEGNIANSEVFMIIFTLAGILRILRGNFTFRSSFIIGFLLSFGSMLRIPAATDFGMIFLMVVLFWPQTEISIKQRIRSGVALLSGFTLPFLITFVYFYYAGAIKEYVIEAFLQNFGYLSTWKGSNNGLYIRSALLLFFTAATWLARNKINRNTLLLLLWLAFSLYGAKMSDRPYPHYLVQLLPPFCLLIGALIYRIRRQEKLMAISGIFLVIATYLLSFWYYPITPYYKNFLLFVTGNNTREEYIKKTGGALVYSISNFITQHSQKNERVFVWGDSPCIYALSNRLPAGKYTAAYHIFDFNGYQETIDSLKANKTKLVITLDAEKHPFPELFSLLQSHYTFYKKIDGASVYLLTNFK